LSVLQRIWATANLRYPPPRAATEPKPLALSRGRRKTENVFNSGRTDETETGSRSSRSRSRSAAQVQHSVAKPKQRAAEARQRATEKTAEGSEESASTNHASSSASPSLRTAATSATATPRRPGTAPPSGPTPYPAVVYPLPDSAFDDCPAYIVYLLWACNFVGIVFSRTLHYQFYTWYFHSLPFLLWRDGIGTPWPLKLLAVAAIEYAFNVGDAAGAGTPASSAILQAAHWFILVGVALGNVPHPRLGFAEVNEPGPEFDRAPEDEDDE
jgi:hypothetical protein